MVSNVKINTRYLRKDDRSKFYEKHSVSELLEFAQARKLRLLRSDKSDKPKLVRLLTNADANFEFPKFLDLPPELRGRVYSHLFDSTALHVRHNSFSHEDPPPITLTSRLIRTESLPQYYSENRFFIVLFRREPWKPHRLVKTWEFFNLMPERYISWLKKLFIRVCNGPYGDSDFNLDLAVGKKVAIAELLPQLADSVGKLGPAAFKEDEIKKVLKGLQMQLDAIAAKESARMTREELLGITSFLTEF